MQSTERVTYLQVLRSSPGFRLLFLARSVSLLGDWFSLIATFALLREVSGADPRALSGVLILRLLPMFFVGPVAGVVADRFNRKGIMVATDLMRALLVLVMIAAPLVPRPVGFVFLLTALQVAGSAFFEPARSAALPQLVPARHLAAANALGAVVWSVMFALGAALGGIVSDLLGWRVALVIDAGTYLFSALLVARIALPRRTRRHDVILDWLNLTGLRDFWHGLRFIARRPAVAATIFIKSGWGIAGALTLFLTLFGERIYTFGGRPDVGVAVLLTARALGTGIGPALARRFVLDESPRSMRRLLGSSFVWSTLWYVLFSWVEHPLVATACVVLAHFGGSVLWVYSTVLLQRMVPDRFLGRVMSTDLGLATLTISASTWLYGRLAALPGADLRLLIRWMALSIVVPAAIWYLAARRLPVGERNAAITSRH